MRSFVGLSSPLSSLSVLSLSPPSIVCGFVRWPFADVISQWLHDCYLGGLVTGRSKRCLNSWILMYIGRKHRTLTYTAAVYLQSTPASEFCDPYTVCVCVCVYFFSFINCKKAKLTAVDS